MRVHVVSDVHGSAAALAAAGSGADVLVCLGDLVLFVDYEDRSGGIFGELFGAEAATRWVELRTAGRLDEARSMLRELWSALGGEPWAHITAAVRRQYAELFAAMPEPTYLTYGNVDIPDLWPEFVRPGHTVLDGQVVTIGAEGRERTFGFVGGGLPSAYRTPYEVPDEEYAAKVEAVFAAATAAGGRVDVLCAHIPPALPELTYDVVARRFERGSEATLAAIREHQPALALFGHVHQPLAARMRIGRTECVNVGHFRGTGKPYVLEW